MINHFFRYQKGLTFNEIYPKIDGYCACGCGRILIKPSKKWFDSKCRKNAYINFSIIKGDNSIIRNYIYLRDMGACTRCGEITSTWQADHIKPVCLGGGGKGIDNFQTLCLHCHKQKTYSLSHHKAISSQAASILLIRNLYEVGQHCNDSLKTS
jgi:hypothetical protein